ncbi:hypothetical protein GCM10022223_41920 [Kineosporia mesophila]|uniref:Transposase n=1 Tax=Kineosporia mesophila TaxID=566012 RepID=A0ABP7A0S7_9ACTN|nr:hypothetical protein [Kineosporia mesophila]
MWKLLFERQITVAGEPVARCTVEWIRHRLGLFGAGRHATELPLAALEMALFTNVIAGEDFAGVVHQSDAGSEHTAIRYWRVLADVRALSPSAPT